ncbi:MAG: response regulator/sensor histidine kinase [Myxococcaceae bacterium]|nr:response regulator/sensor histidine kinase [Myxococcaceae bacterium]
MALVTVNILVVDDLPANTLALQALLAPLGHKVVCASSGIEALALAAEHDFAVILLDLMMPVLDGIGTLERLRVLERTRSTPVVFVTAYHPERAVQEKAYSLGALDFMEKPIHVDLMRAKVKAFVALYQQSAEIRRQAEALRTKDRHIGVLAHDLRNPLSVIAIGAQNIARQAPAAKAVAQRMTRAAARMERLVENLLSFALAAEKGVVLNRSQVDLSALCAEVVEDVQSIYPKVTFDPELEGKVVGWWDAQQVEQALANLLGNAAKYGAGHVSMQLRYDDDWVALQISNGGPPIAPELLELLFKPFVQGAVRRDGVGLGLYIVKEIAVAHGGDVLAQSDAAQTRFTLRLPRSHGSAEALPSLAAQEQL